MSRKQRKTVDIDTLIANYRSAQAAEAAARADYESQRVAADKLEYGEERARAAGFVADAHVVFIDAQEATWIACEALRVALDAQEWDLASFADWFEAAFIKLEAQAKQAKDAALAELEAKRTARDELSKSR